MAPQKAREPIELTRRAVQRDHARRGWSSKWRDHPERVFGLGEQGLGQTGKAGADFFVSGSAGARGDVVEDDARGFTRSGRPFRAARRNQVSLAAQDQAIVE